MSHASPTLAGPTTWERATVIRQLNDALRCNGEGGRIMITAGVAALPAATQARVLEAVARFDAFTDANDAFEEHDFGTLRVDGVCVFFKTDYYDHTLTMHSLDPAVAAVTCRVLTVGLGSEF